MTEALWRGSFGDAYTSRSPGDISANVAFFARALQRCEHIESILELGAGVGHNLRALNVLLPHASQAAVEINEKAAHKISGRVTVYPVPIREFAPDNRYSLVFTKGVLIHLPYDALEDAYRKLHAASARYVLMAEYFSAVDRMVPYRGVADALWTRPYGEHFRGMFPATRLVDYGFVGKQDLWPQDSLTWWLFEVPE